MGLFCAAPWRRLGRAWPPAARQDQLTTPMRPPRPPRHPSRAWGGLKPTRAAIEGRGTLNAQYDREFRIGWGCRIPHPKGRLRSDNYACDYDRAVIGMNWLANSGVPVAAAVERPCLQRCAVGAFSRKLSMGPVIAACPALHGQANASRMGRAPIRTRVGASIRTQVDASVRDARPHGRASTRVCTEARPYRRASNGPYGSASIRMRVDARPYGRASCTDASSVRTDASTHVLYGGRMPMNCRADRDERSH